MTQITHPLIKEYADRCNADFIILDDNKGLHPHYRIMQLYGIFETYTDVLSMDSDILILPNTPNLFEVVEKGRIGTIFEDKGSRQADRRNRIRMSQEKLGYVGWTEGYPNSGVMVLSREHREIFNGEPLWMDLGYDDVHIGYKAHKLNIPFQELPFQFNHMVMHSEEWNDYANRFDSHIIHYAGQGFFPPIPREEQIRRDYEYISNSAVKELANS